MAQNGIIGDDSYGIDLPETQVDEQTINEQQAAARFSKTKEYKALKEHLQSRMKFYQTYLPDGRPAVSETDLEKQKHMWTIANTIIGEFQAVIDAYEQAAEYAKEHSRG